MARTPVLPKATDVGVLSALCGLLGQVRLALVHAARTATSSPAQVVCASYTIAIPFSASSRPTTASASGEVHREPLEIGELAVVEGVFVRSPQDYAGRLARLERFLPARRTQAPAVAGPQPGKAEFWHRRRKIVAAGFRKLEELSSHDGADGVATDVFSTRIAAPVSEEPRQRLHRAIFESVAKNIPGRFWPAPAVPAVFPQHRQPLDSRHVSNTRNRRPPTVGAGARPRPGGRAPVRSEARWPRRTSG
jgi:hypothetical protein